MRICSRLQALQFGVALCAVALASQISVAQSASDISVTDKHFLPAALKGGMAEVAMGKLAAKKGTTSDVREFGEKMVEDHTNLGEQMKKVASQVGVAHPASPSTLEQAEIKKLGNLSGVPFDEEYIKAMVKDHETDLQDFQDETKTGSNTTVKNAANEGASMIANHLTMIREIAKKHNLAQ